MTVRKRSSAPRVRKPKAAKVEGVPFVARFHENERAGHECSCAFPEQCDGSRLIHCQADLIEAESGCACEACPGEIAEHVTGCAGCENCRASVCVVCGKRAPELPAVEGDSWACSPECTRKMFTTVAS